MSELQWAMRMLHVGHALRVYGRGDRWLELQADLMLRDARSQMARICRAHSTVSSAP